MTEKHDPLTYTDYVKGLSQLTANEQLRLLDLIAANLRKDIVDNGQRHSILELEGLGSEIWQDVNVTEYVQQERASWD